VVCVRWWPGSIQPAVSEVDDALQATHTGKVTVARPPAIGSDGGVTVLGGLGGLGSIVARWLVNSCGVQELTLLSRSGRTSKGLPAGEHT